MTLNMMHSFIFSWQYIQIHNLFSLDNITSYLQIFSNEICFRDIWILDLHFYKKNLLIQSVVFSSMR